ncbi:MAG: cupin domain-containing protein [Proteobacteria bacterium]|nr:MAG: cupin domain-containing protein [Pseudomonadota bacterium]
MTPENPSPVWVNLLEACAAGAHRGPQWAHESDDLDMTLLSWPEGKCIEAHRNPEVDVVLVGVEGAGVVSVDGKAHELRPGLLLLIPKGSERSIESTSQRFSYLSLHQRRRGLMPVPNW